MSARYSGQGSASNRKKLLANLKSVQDRSAYFVCNLVKMEYDGSYITAEGKTEGYIVDKEYGDTSFGYDSIFYANDLGKVFGLATVDEKTTVSHRGRAIKKLMLLNTKGAKK